MRKAVTFLVAALLLSVAACDIGKSCKESCEKDAECGRNYLCLTSDQGRMCLPRECRDCFSSEDTPYCHHDDETIGEGEGAELRCTFEECASF